MKFLILLLVSLGLSTEWGTSFSVRTPNDDTKDLDYELSIKLEDTTNTNILLVYAQDSDSHVGTYSNHPLVFDTNSTERVKAVKYSVLYMKAIKALQEAQTRIETLEIKVTALEAK